MTTIASTAMLDASVEIGDGSMVEDFVSLGVMPSSIVPPLVVGRSALIRSHTVIYAGNTIGDRFQTGHGVLVRELNTIGSDVSIGSHSIVEHHVVIGDRVRIHSGAFIPEFTVVEHDAWIGPMVTITNAAYPRSRDAKAALKGPTIHAGAKIGANSTLLPGVVIGRDALVGAGSVVVKDVPGRAVVVGNPARIIRHIQDIDAYRTLSDGIMGDE